MSKRWWVWKVIVAGPLSGLLFGLLMTLIDQSHDWRGGLFAGVFFGMFFGAFMIYYLVRLMRQQRSAMGEAPSEQVQGAMRMLRGKSVPADPELRETVYRLATYKLEQARRWRIPGAVISGLLILITVFNAFRSVGWYSWFYWAIAVFFVFMLAFTEWQLVRLSRRVEMLRPGSEGSPEAG